MNYKEGIKFECQGSSNCCVSRGSYGYVYLSKKDIIKLSKFKKIKIKEFVDLYCDKTDGFTHLKEDIKNKECQFLDKKKCTVYEARPIQCRTWPFWSENMKAKTWSSEVKKFCPGVGKGKIFTQNKINKIIKQDKENENEMLKDSD